MPSGRSPREPFADRRAHVRDDVQRTVRTYSKLADVYTDAITDHAKSAVNYVTDLLDQDQSAGEIVKNGLGLLIGCCMRQKKMWHDLCGAVHDDAVVTEPEEGTPPEPDEKPGTGSGGSAGPGATGPVIPEIVLQVDADAETTSIVRTLFRRAELNMVVLNDLMLQGGVGTIPRANILLSYSQRSDNRLEVSLFGLRSFAAGTYIGTLGTPTAEVPRVVQITLIKSAPIL